MSRWRVSANLIQRIVGTLFVTAAVAVVVHRTETIFTPEYRVVPVLIATVATALAAMLVSPLRWWARVLVIGSVSLAATGFVIAAMSGELPDDLLRAPVSGVGDLLGTVWPSPPLAAGVGALAFYASMASAFGADRAMHRRPGAALLAPITLLGLVALLAAPAGPPPAWSIAALVVASLGVLASPNVSHRSGVTTIAVVVVAALVASIPLVVSDHVSAHRYDPRLALESPVVPIGGISPLARLDEWRSLSPPADFFTTTLQVPTRWRLVGLTRYDGRTWLPADDYRRAGSVLTQGDDALPTDRVTVTIGELDAAWLPSIDRTLSVTSRVRVDGGRSGLLAEAAPTPGTTYEVGLQPFVVAPAQLTYARAARVAPPFVGDFAPSPQLLELASSITAGARNDYERAEALAAYLRNGFVLDADSPPGHSIAVLNLFIDLSRRGADEQFVAMYGLLAAAIGLPVRIAVGFETDITDDGSGTVARSSRAVAWPEIEFESFGWVPFDPLPDAASTLSPSRGDGAIAPTDELTDEQPPAPAPMTTQTTLPDNSEVPETAVIADAGRQLTLAAFVAIFAGVLVAALMLYIGVIMLLKAGRRRRRRNAPDPRDRAVGAFLTGIESMIDLRVIDPTAGTTNGEVVDRDLVHAGVSLTAIREVASLATESVFRSALVAEHRADDSWEATARFERRIAHEAGVLRRLRAKASTRSLRRRWR